MTVRRAYSPPSPSSAAASDDIKIRPSPRARCAFVASNTHAQLTIDIVGVGAQQIPVAVAGFRGADPNAQQMSSVIEADLGRSGLIKTVNSNGLPRSAEACRCTVRRSQGGAAPTLLSSVRAADRQWPVQRELPAG